MDANISLDVGNNLLGVANRMAATMGVTVEQVWPWYVKQQVIEGYIELLCFGVAWGVVLSVFCLGVSGLVKRWDEDFRFWAIFCSAMAGVLLFVATLLFGPTSYGKVVNPEYHATHAIIQEVKSLVR